MLRRPEKPDREPLQVVNVTRLIRDPQPSMQSLILEIFFVLGFERVPRLR